MPQLCPILNKTDEAILAILRSNHREEFVSGAEIAAELGISRTAVWKHLNRLRNAGYQLESERFLGYKLVGTPDLLLAPEIKEGLQTSRFGHVVVAYGETGSTNDDAAAIASVGGEEGTLVVAESQSSGRGRLGRRWASRPGVGIWASLVLRPNIPPRYTARLTIVASVSVAEVLRSHAGLDAVIEWPNDVTVAGRKLCGILTELVAEQDRVEFGIVGIGINVNHTERSFPRHLRDTATSIFIETGKRANRVELLQRFLEQFERDYELFKTKGFEPLRRRWRSLSYTLGKRVTCESGDTTLVGVAQDLGPDGALVVRTDAGKKVNVVSGDVRCL